MKRRWRKTLQAVEEMCAQLDEDALDASLARGALELSGARQVWVFKLEQTSLNAVLGEAVAGYDVRPDSDAGSPIAPSAIAALSGNNGWQSICGPCSLLHDERHQAVVLPVLLHDRVYALLALRGRALQHLVLQPLLHHLATIYSLHLNTLHMGQRDTLTGLTNRRTFEAELYKASIRHLRVKGVGTSERRQSLVPERAAWLGVLDIDHFKLINDSFGHLYGDEVLIILANLMRQTFRQCDSLFRLGGEEFAVALQANTLEEALAAFERFRSAVAAFHFPGVGRVTISIGFARLYRDEPSSVILGRADEALYFSKQNGRNQVHGYENLVSAGLLQPDIATGEVELF